MTLYKLVPMHAWNSSDYTAFTDPIPICETIEFSVSYYSTAALIIYLASSLVSAYWTKYLQRFAEH
jgi:hypothetical protein